ncbi:DNA excision repair protein ERCC-1-like [Amphiura filiformis]|uniref:DNA excision repair protein ERCC-1-like n=1 Tax=Amphiura filiformis TaxID=82378 RepID=UPI003B212927
MSSKKLFSIPSIWDIKEYEKKKPEVKSHFKVSSTKSDGNSTDENQGNASTSSSSTKHTSSVQCSSTHSSSTTTASSQGKRTHDTSKDVHQPSVKLTRMTGDNAGDVMRTSKEFQKAVVSGSRDTEGIEPGHGQGTSEGSAQPGVQQSSKSIPSGSGIYAVPSIPAAPIKATTAAPNSIMVNPRQRGNPILKHVRNVPWQFGDIVPDYVLGRTVCALYLSLRYHHLNPNYIHDRLKELGHSFELRVLLVQVDVKDPHHSLKELARMAILADCTLLLAWSAEEAGRYLETYKAYENKPSDALKERIEQDYLSKMQDCLTTVKSVKKNDVVTLLTTFGTLDKIIAASKEDLSLVPGFGSLKAQRLHNMFHEPFLKSKKTKPGDQEKSD